MHKLIPASLNELKKLCNIAFLKVYVLMHKTFELKEGGPSFLKPTDGAQLDPDRGILCVTIINFTCQMET